MACVGWATACCIASLWWAMSLGIGIGFQLSRFLMFAFQEFQWIPFVDLFKDFLSCSVSIFSFIFFHIRFAGQHEPQASQNSGRGGPGKLPPQLQARKTPKRISNRQDTPSQTKNSPLPASDRADSAGIAPGWPFLILLLLVGTCWHGAPLHSYFKSKWPVKTT